jgi:GAF domain-containing protein
VAKRGRALIATRTMVIELREHEDLVVGAVAGEASVSLVGQRLRFKNTVASAAMLTSTTQRLEDERSRARFDEYGLGRLGVRVEGGLVVPLTLRGGAYGVLVALDRLDSGPRFTAHDQQLLE